MHCFHHYLLLDNRKDLCAFHKTLLRGQMLIMTELHFKMPSYFSSSGIFFSATITQSRVIIILGIAWILIVL